MLRAALVFFAIAIGAAILGFGGVAGAFSSLAVLAFYLFIALFVISLLAGLVTGGGHHAGGGALVTILVAGLIGAGIYAWSQHGYSAASLGRSVDRAAADLSHDAKAAIRTAQTETGAAAEKITRDAHEAADRANDKSAQATSGR